MASKIGTFVKIKIGTKLLVGETSLNLASAAEAIETSSKASANESTFEYGRINRTLSVSSIGTSDSTETNYNFTNALQAQIDCTKVAYEVTEFDKSTGLEVVGAHNITGNALITNVSWDSPDNDVQTFSLDLQGDDSITLAVNS